jgi:hypothetical protein
VRRRDDDLPASDRVRATEPVRGREDRRPVVGLDDPLEIRDERPIRPSLRVVRAAEPPGDPPLDCVPPSPTMAQPNSSG